MTGRKRWKGPVWTGPTFRPNPKYYYESDRCRSRSRSSISFGRFFRRAAKRRAAIQQPTAVLPTAVLPTAALPTAIEANAYLASIQQFCLPCLHAAAPVPETTALWERIRQLHMTVIQINSLTKKQNSNKLVR
jgi:endonuclease/exonuclease/phosphatase (EEP) superfamily protein YafD